MTSDLIHKIQVEGLDLILNAPANVDAMGRIMTLPNGGIVHGFTHDQPLIVL